MFKVGIGQDSHRIVRTELEKPLKLGGIEFKTDFCLLGNSDADVVIHALTNAVSGITGKPVLGKVADELCKRGVKDSQAYLDCALEDLKRIRYRVCHVSLSIEAQIPRISSKINQMQSHLAAILGIGIGDVGITGTSGEGLTAFGRGEGIQVLAVMTARAF